MKKLMHYFILGTIVIHYHKIGTEPWCAVNKADKTIMCNYENWEACEGYRQENETCIKNKDYKPKKENTNEDMPRYY